MGIRITDTNLETMVKAHTCALRYLSKSDVIATGYVLQSSKCGSLLLAIMVVSWSGKSKNL